MWRDRGEKWIVLSLTAFVVAMCLAAIAGIVWLDWIR